jgi:hypothetical protein
MKSDKDISAPMISTWEEAMAHHAKRDIPWVEVLAQGDSVYVSTRTKWFDRIEFKPLELPFPVWAFDRAIDACEAARDLLMSRESVQ